MNQENPKKKKSCYNRIHRFSVMILAKNTEVNIFNKIMQSGFILGPFSVRFSDAALTIFQEKEPFSPQYPLFKGFFDKFSFQRPLFLVNRTLLLNSRIIPGSVSTFFNPYEIFLAFHIPVKA